MPMTGDLKIDQDQRASWFSHKAEKAMPYYYSVYLSEYNLTTEITPTERCACFRFTFPETEKAYVVVDAFDQGSYIKIISEENKIIGYTNRNSGGVPDNFRNYFVIVFDKPFTFHKVWKDYHTVDQHLELQANHVGAAIGFATQKGEQVHARVASSFISPGQAELKPSGNRPEKLRQHQRNRTQDMERSIGTHPDRRQQHRPPAYFLFLHVPVGALPPHVTRNKRPG